MGFKDMNRNRTFTDLSLSPSMEKNRAIKRMEEINAIVNWSPIEALLEQTYPVGNHINDRISFKRFLGLSFDDPAPDHSTFSRFRGRLSTDTLRQVNSELLSQFAARGCTINEGVVVDARLVQSASRPISTGALKEEREKRKAREGKLDRKGKKRKFFRDIESDWTAEKDRPLFGLKEHAAVDTRYGFLLARPLHNYTKPPFCHSPLRALKPVFTGFSARKGESSIIRSLLDTGLRRYDD